MLISSRHADKFVGKLTTEQRRSPKLTVSRNVIAFSSLHSMILFCCKDSKSAAPRQILDIVDVFYRL